VEGGGEYIKTISYAKYTANSTHTHGKTETSYSVKRQKVNQSHYRPGGAQRVPGS